MSESETPTVILVHGAFVDGSGWQGVYEQLKKDGYRVSVVQNRTLSLADDVAVTQRAIDAASEPVILVGHSYAGVVVTEAGTHPKAAALVYIAAFAPDEGESLNTISSGRRSTRRSLPRSAHKRFEVDAQSGVAGSTRSECLRPERQCREPSAVFRRSTRG